MRLEWLPAELIPSAARVSLLFVAGLGLSGLACGGSRLPVGPTVPTLVQVGGSTRAIQTVLDLDTVRSVAVANDRVWVATDKGLLWFPASGEPTDATATRLRAADGLPSDDVVALAVAPDGALVVGTGDGFARVIGDAVERQGTVLAPVGALADIRVDGTGATWACGSEGVAVHREDAWTRFGEPITCRRFVAESDSAFWVVGTSAVWRVEGDVIREHSVGRALPEGTFVRLLPRAQGRMLALFAQPDGLALGYFDGMSWATYTIDALDAPVADLVETSTCPALILPGHALCVVEEGGEGTVPLTPLWVGEPNRVLSYRARVTEEGDLPVSETASASRPSGAGETRDLVRVPPGHPTLEAVPLYVRPASEQVPARAYAAWQTGAGVFVAHRNQGVVDVSSGRRLSSMDAVDPNDLQIASDENGTTYFLGRDRDLAVWDGNRLVRVAPLEGLTPQAIATGPHGVYVAALVASAATEAPRTARLLRRAGSGWTTVVERVLTPSAPLLRLTFLGVGEDESAWVGLEVPRDGGTGTVRRGVAVFGPQTETVVYHHFGAAAATDGEGALPLPDDASTIDLAQRGNAWFATLSGAARLGNHQVVVFGEARGVRGEVVSDVAVGTNDRVWVAAAEGLGYYENQAFEFGLPEVGRVARPTALAVDTNGDLWAAGPRGLVFYDGNQFTQVSLGDDVTPVFADVEVDSSATVWLLLQDRVIVFSRSAGVAGGRTTAR